MELKFVFTGIETEADGTNPRAVLRAQPARKDWPHDSALPRVFIELPLAGVTGDLAQIAARATQAATQALSVAPLQAWITGQQLPPVPEANPAVPDWIHSAVKQGLQG